MTTLTVLIPSLGSLRLPVTRQGTTLPTSNGSAVRIKVVQGSVLLPGEVTGARTLCFRTSNESSGNTRAKQAVTHYTSQSTAYLAKGQGEILTGSPHTTSYTSRLEEVPRPPASQQQVNCRTIRVLYFKVVRCMKRVLQGNQSYILGSCLCA